MPKVLIIDDDDIVRDLLVLILTKNGTQTVAVRDGVEGIAELEALSFDLVITDIVMPEKDGLEVIMEIKKRWPTLPMIALSGGGRICPDSYLTIAKKFGVTHAFSKPFDRHELLNAVQSLLFTSEDEPSY